MAKFRMTWRHNSTQRN